MEQISAIIIVISSVSKLIYAKVSIQSVLYFSIVVFLSYLVRQFLFVIGIINDFKKKPLHTFFEYAMFIILVCFSLWMLNEVFNITKQEYVWTVTRIFFVAFFAVCVRSHVVSYFKQNATTIGSIFLMLMGSVCIIILFSTDGMSWLFVLFVPMVYASGSEMVPGEGTQEGTQQMALVAVNRESSSAEQFAEQLLHNARMERMIFCSPTADLVRISGTDYKNRWLREIYGKPLCRLRLSNKDFGSMIKGEFIDTIDGRKRIMPQLSLGEMVFKLEERIAGRSYPPITHDQLKAWFANGFDTNMAGLSESSVRAHYDNLLFFCPVFYELVYPERIYYHLSKQTYDTVVDINILLEQVRFTHANYDKLPQLLTETQSAYLDAPVGQRSALEKELVKLCLESKKHLALELQDLRRQQDSLNDPLLEPVLKNLISWTGLDEKRDLARFLAQYIKTVHLRYNHDITLNLLAVIEEKRVELRVSEALNALKSGKRVWNGQKIKPEFLTFNRKHFDASKEIKLLRPTIWAPLPQYIQTVNEQDSIKRIKTSYKEETEWHINNPLLSNPNTMETEGSESSDRDAQTKKRKCPV